MFDENINGSEKDELELYRLFIESVPFACSMWDENFNIVDCNSESLFVFDFMEKVDMLSDYFKCSPQNQPDGSDSREKFNKNLRIAFDMGYYNCDWLHQTSQGEKIPVRMILFNIRRDMLSNFVVVYVQDQRELLLEQEKNRQATEHTRMMFDALPICCNLWDLKHNIIDCNNAAVKLFDLKSKEEYIEQIKNNVLSTKKQPDERTSSEKWHEMLDEAYEKEEIHFEWMFRKLDDSLIPAAVTMVKVKSENGFNIVSYVQDLRDVKNALKTLNHFEKLAYTDALTGIYNRRYFKNAVQLEYEAAQKENKMISILMMDIDHFKIVNDTYGHPVGDEVLKNTAEIIQSCLRSTDILARYGGEEFIIMIAGANKDIAIMLAERIRLRIEKAVIEKTNNINITISIGAASSINYPPLQDMITKADTALYSAKQTGRNKSIFFD